MNSIVRNKSFQSLSKPLTQRKTASAKPAKPIVKTKLRLKIVQWAEDLKRNQAAHLEENMFGFSASTEEIDDNR